MSRRRIGPEYRDAEPWVVTDPDGVYGYFGCLLLVGAAFFGFLMGWAVLR